MKFCVEVIQFRGYLCFLLFLNFFCNSINREKKRVTERERERERELVREERTPTKRVDEVYLHQRNTEF